MENQNKKQINRTVVKWTRVAVLAVGLGSLSTLSFNCGGHKFEAAGDVDMSSTSLSTGTFDKPNTPYALMTAEQTFQSMLNVTGQSGVITSTQKTEYDLRANSMSDNDNLALINAPLMMATTSMAGEICNGLLAKEKALAATDRRFFQQVDFSKAVSQNSTDVYSATADLLAQSFYGRSLSESEQTTLISFYQEFVSGLDAASATQPVQTSNLYLSLCSGMLGSFDSIVF